MSVSPVRGWRVSAVGLYIAGGGEEGNGGEVKF